MELKKKRLMARKARKTGLGERTLGVKWGSFEKEGKTGARKRNKIHT